MAARVKRVLAKDLVAMVRCEGKRKSEAKMMDIVCCLRKICPLFSPSSPVSPVRASHAQEREAPEQMQNYSNESSFLGASQDDVPIAEAIPMTTNGTNSRLSVMSGPNGTRGKTRELNRDQINDLVEQGYSLGLIKALSQNSHDFDFRFWIVDNSGSMQIGDGSRIVTSGKSDGSLKAVRATRWEELKDTVQYVVD